MNRSQLTATHCERYHDDDSVPMVELAAVGSETAVIVRAHDERELSRIADPQVQAVIYTPPAPPPRRGALGAAIERGAFHVPRTVLPRASRDEIAGWLAAHLPPGDADGDGGSPPGAG